MKDKAKAAERQRRYRARHPEKAREIERRKYERHRERYLAYQRALRASNPELLRAKHLRAKYGITISEYDAMHDSQGGLCAICREPETAGYRLAVDHDHDTGAVRALLCSSCNRGLGFFADDTDRLRTAAAYLERFR